MLGSIVPGVASVGTVGNTEALAGPEQGYAPFAAVVMTVPEDHLVLETQVWHL